jgi:hypothetical protein
MLSLVRRLGTPWSTRPRARSCRARWRYSDQLPKTEGVGLERWRSPSILSQGRVLIDRPTKPASIDSPQLPSITEVTPWRRLSPSAGASSTSAS